MWKGQTYHDCFLLGEKLNFSLFSFQGKNKQEDGSLSRRSRTLSTSSLSKKSEPTPKRSGITFFRIVAATRAWQRLAKKKNRQPPAPSKPVVRLENTYQLEPNEDNVFIPKKAENIIRETFDSRLQHVKYDSVRSKILAKDLATIVNTKIKDLEIPRYKTVSSVTIIENKGQGLKIATRCIWNTDTDNYATYTYTNQSLIAIGHVHAVYYDWNCAIAGNVYTTICRNLLEELSTQYMYINMIWTIWFIIMFNFF